MRYKTIKIQKKARSFQQNLLLILLPIFILLCCLICINVIELRNNRKLAEQYIEDTTSLYLDRVNREMGKINYRLISITEDEMVQSIPNDISSSESKYFSLLDNIRGNNKLENIQYSEVALFFSYSQPADVMITQEGTVFSSSQKSEKYRVIMDYLHENAINNTQTSQWDLLEADGEDFILGWYCKNRKCEGVIINMEHIYNILCKPIESYNVIPVLEDRNGIVYGQEGTEEAFLQMMRTKIDSKSDDVYSYQLIGIGNVYLYHPRNQGIMLGYLRIQALFVALIAIFLIVAFFAVKTYIERVMRPIEQFVDNLENLDEEQMLNDNGRNNILELEAANGKFRELIKKIQSLKIAIYEQELEEKKAELEYMQEQARPHFFLNCISLIHGIADANGQEDITHITEVLSTYLRYIIRDSRKKRKISEELEQVEAYINLQTLRYGKNAFGFEMDVDESLKSALIPPLIIQILVENVIVHQMSLDKYIDISLFMTREEYGGEEFIYLCVSDTGNGFTKEALDALKNDTPIFYNGRNHVGLKNIIRRLDLLYDKRASIEFSNMADGYGAVVEVRIPLEFNSNYR